MKARSLDPRTTRRFLRELVEAGSRSRDTSSELNSSLPSSFGSFLELSVLSHLNRTPAFGRAIERRGRLGNKKAAALLIAAEEQPVLSEVERRHHREIRQ